MWDYLIRSTPEEIRRLPAIVETIDDLTVCQEAKWLIGFNLNHGTTRPGKTPNAWMRAGAHTTSFWGEAWKERIASQVSQIKHWVVKQQSYVDIDDVVATWFIDPPYYKSGSFYVHNKVDYKSLGDWCRTRSGQVIVCEQGGADWLPFEHFLDIKTMEGSRGKKRGEEVIWMNGQQEAQLTFNQEPE